MAGARPATTIPALGRVVYRMASLAVAMLADPRSLQKFDGSPAPEHSLTQPQILSILGVYKKNMQSHEQEKYVTWPWLQRVGRDGNRYQSSYRMGLGAEVSTFLLQGS